MKFFDDIDIIVRDFSTGLPPPHQHPYFELLYVLSGEGIHTINGNDFEYGPATLFMLTPEDKHIFQPILLTRCCIIDFTRNLFTRNRKGNHDRAELSEFFIRLEYIFHHHHYLKGNILAGRSEAHLFNEMINQLIKEKQSQAVYSDLITQNIVFLLLQLIARIINEESSGITDSRNKNRVYEITGYIQQHIYDKKLLKIENLALHFHKTPDHINRYFKKETGTTLKEYINQYKVNLVISRLLYSSLSVSEIADELQFTDESHLNKVFKKYKQQTAKDFKSANRL